MSALVDPRLERHNKSRTLRLLEDKVVLLKAIRALLSEMEFISDGMGDFRVETICTRARQATVPARLAIKEATR